MRTKISLSVLTGEHPKREKKNEDIKYPPKHTRGVKICVQKQGLCPLEKYFIHVAILSLWHGWRMRTVLYADYIETCCMFVRLLLLLNLKGNTENWKVTFSYSMISVFWVGFCMAL